MSIIDDDTITDEREIDPAVEDFSWVEEVSQEHDEAVEEEWLRMGMPSWGDPPDLVVEFKVLEKKIVTGFLEQQRKARRKKGEEADVDADVRFICESTRYVYMRRPDTRKLVRLEKDGVPIGLDKRLGNMLKLDAEKNKNSVTLLMHLVKDNDLALANLSGKIAQWMTNTSQEVEGQVLGE